MPIVRKIYETVASQMPGADIVAIGKGGSDLDLTGLKPLNTPLKPFDYDGYRDSAQQVLLKQVPNEL
ncbi:hypothetical protein ACI4BE_28140, partial [Klebsiella pneumoniae]|uniref:hypothetical protein n=1 Tax=Klebsiella pneumoniae TaxID=573 RepID=UPI0038549155